MNRLLLAVCVLAAAAGTAGVALAQKETRGITKTEIVLGMHTDLSGPAATYGVSSSNAVKMRFDEVNEAGGIHGRKIRLIVEDSARATPGLIRATEEMGCHVERVATSESSFDEVFTRLVKRYA